MKWDCIHLGILDQFLSFGGPWPRHPMTPNLQRSLPPPQNSRADVNANKRRRAVVRKLFLNCRSLIEEEMSESHPKSPDDESRTIWIRCHPAIFSAILTTLKNAVSLSLDTLKKSPGYSQNSYSIEVIDLRNSINVFEITGPKSSQIVHGALTPTIANHTGDFKKVKHIELSPQSD